MSNKLLIEKLATTENVNLSLNETYEIPLATTSYWTIPESNPTTWNFQESFVSAQKIQIDVEGEKRANYILSSDENKEYFSLSADKEKIYTFKDFQGNYYGKKNSIKIIESKIIDFNINANQPITFECQTTNDLIIKKIKITPVKEIKSTEIEYKGEIVQLENGGNRYIAKIYNKNNEDITSKCTFKWYSYNKGQWVQEEKQNTSYGYFSKAPDNLAVQAFIDSHTIEIYKGKNAPSLNNGKDIYYFVYNKYNTIDSSLLNQEYIIGDLSNFNNNNYWNFLDNVVPFGLTDYSKQDTMIKNTWIDSYNRLHFQIKTSYDINNYDNRFTFNQINYEIFFGQEGDQGVHPEGYSCIVRPSDNKGNLTGSYYAQRVTDRTYLRVMFFYKGILQDPNLFQKNSSKSTDGQEINYRENFISNEEVPIIFRDSDGNITENNYITSSFQLKNSSKTIVMSIITPMPYGQGDYYPMYIKYSKTGFNPIYITNIKGFINEVNELSSTEKRQFRWKNDFSYPALRFISIDNTISIEGWNGQSITTGTNNIIDSSQAGVGIVNNNQFTGMVLGIQEKNYGLYGYEDGNETIHLIANGKTKGANIIGLTIKPIYDSDNIQSGIALTIPKDYTIQLPSASLIKIPSDTDPTKLMTLKEYVQSLMSST